VDIKEDSVIVEVGGQRQELRMRLQKFSSQQPTLTVGGKAKLNSKMDSVALLRPGNPII
jgi:hypothetical protein